MSRPSAERDEARLALVGAATAAGAALREALARRGVAGARVNLFAMHAGAGTVSEYAGEARLLQDPDEEAIARHEVIFLCEAGPWAKRLAGAPPAGSTVVDLVGAGATSAGVVQVAHPLALLLERVLAPLHRAFEVREAVGVLALPAAELGEGAVEELRQQVVRLLGFAEPPTAHLGHRLAFDVLHGSSVGRTEGLDRRVARDVAGLLGWSEERLALQRLIVPVFHGVGLQLRVRLERTATLDGLAEALREAGVPVGEPAGAATPSQAAEAGSLTVVRVTEDGLGGFWLWVVSDDPGAWAGRHALELAAARVGL